MADNLEGPSPTILVLGGGMDAEVEAAGGYPLTASWWGNQDINEALNYADGVILTGGTDINPILYGEKYEHSTVWSIDHARDDTELRAIAHCLQMNKPIFGICRGAQMINVAMGGTLVQDLASMANRHSHFGQRHDVLIRRKSGLFNAVGRNSILGESIHHQAVAQLGSNLVPVGWAYDGTIEAIESVSGTKPYLLGVQFHPEEDASYVATSQEIFNYWVWRVAVNAGLLGFERQHFTHRSKFHSTGQKPWTDEDYTWEREVERGSFSAFVRKSEYEWERSTEDKIEDEKWWNEQLEKAEREYSKIHGITDRMDQQLALPATTQRHNHKRGKRRRKHPVKHNYKGGRR